MKERGRVIRNKKTAGKNCEDWEASSRAILEKPRRMLESSTMPTGERMLAYIRNKKLR